MKKLTWPDTARLKDFLSQYKYIFLVAAAGVLLLLWPAGGQRDAHQEEPAEGSAGVQEEFDLEELEEKLSAVLSQVEGAGQVTVALTLKSGMERVLASDRETSADPDGRGSWTTETVILDGDGREETVLISQNYPTFQGAVVVCRGGADPQVRLLLTQAVSALTGLGADRITVCKGESPYQSNQ